MTIEETSAAERLALFGRAFALTPREPSWSDCSPLARTPGRWRVRWHVSEHTVQDHLKSIFTKTGARDRVTVLARALGTGRAPGR